MKYLAQGVPSVQIPAYRNRKCKKLSSQMAERKEVAENTFIVCCSLHAHRKDPISDGSVMFCRADL